jgi:multidrug efflux pump subunit AcrB
MKWNKAKKHRSCAMKLDIRKAYDKVEGSYLKALILKLGFKGSWVALIMCLVSMISFYVLFNGAPREFFPSSGIRQGDPIVGV